MVQNSGTDELTSAVTGAIGGALSLSITYPLQTITTKLQTHNIEEGKSEEKIEMKNVGKYEELLEKVKELDLYKIIMSIVHKDGVSGMYSGLESAMVGMVFTNFIYYYVFEKTSNIFKRVRGNKQRFLTAGESIVASSIAGSITATLTNPIWVANTRMTVKKSNNSTFQEIKSIIEEDGPKAVFKGLKYALVLVLNPVIQYSAFEQMKNLVISIKNHEHRKNNEKLSFYLSPNWAFVLGFISKLLATSITYPYITIKARAHMEHNKIDTKNKDQLSEKEVDLITKLTNIELIKVIKKEGFKGLYSGFIYKVSQSVLTVALLFYFKEGLALNAQRILKLIRTLKTKQVKN